jgi:hypothetical protein
MVPVREEVPVFAVKLAVIVPLFVPEPPAIMDNHDDPLVTAAVQFIVPLPVFATSNVVVPADEDTFLLSGVKFIAIEVLSTWCTSTFFGLPVVPGAVTVMIPMRVPIAGFCVKLTMMVPLFVPEPPEIIDNHDAPLVTAAVQFIVPPPVLATSNVVVPADDSTATTSGVTDKTGVGTGLICNVLGKTNSSSYTTITMMTK